MSGFVKVELANPVLTSVHVPSKGPSRLIRHTHTRGGSDQTNLTKKCWSVPGGQGWCFSPYGEACIANPRRLHIPSRSCPPPAQSQHQCTWRRRPIDDVIPVALREEYWETGRAVGQLRPVIISPRHNNKRSDCALALSQSLRRVNTWRVPEFEAIQLASA